MYFGNKKYEQYKLSITHLLNPIQATLAPVTPLLSVNLSCHMNLRLIKCILVITYLLDSSGLPLAPALQLSEYGHQEPSRGLGFTGNFGLETQNKKI